MIKTFQDKDLEDCFENGNCRKIKQDLRNRVLRKLDALDVAGCLEDLKSPPGNRLHPLQGERKGTWAIAVSGAWRITFEFEDGDAYNVALEQYH